jgi:N-acetylneuraminic acid mutarotase
MKNLACFVRLVLLTPLAFTQMSESIHAALWVTNGSLNLARFGHSATLLPDGQVLIAGGVCTNGSSTNVAELYDPATGLDRLAKPMISARTAHTATLLLNGQVLITGGINGDQTLSESERYDSATGKWTATGAMKTTRHFHTTTLLPNGKVLAVGGLKQDGALNDSCELYDPITQTWNPTGSLNVGRFRHSATVLPNGQVLVAAGFGDNVLSSAELFDPATGKWSMAGDMKAARTSHTATLLPDGQVLVAGGLDARALATHSAELFDPSSGSWTFVGSMNDGRSVHTATLLPNGIVLVTGGISDGLLSPKSAVSSTEVYDRIARTWTETSELNSTRWHHTATLLANGSVLVVGGQDNYGAALAVTETFDPSSGFWSPTGSSSIPRFRGKSILLPTGKVLSMAGTSNSTAITSTELFDPAPGAWSPAAPLTFGRIEPTATLLLDGSVLLAGGFGITNFVSASERYNPTTGLWQTNGPLNTPRAQHTATLLLNGKVLIAGGNDATSSGPSRSAELYDPATGNFTPTGPMSTCRSEHGAIRLKSGKVLVVAGLGTNATVLNSAELFNPGAGTWAPTAPLPLGLTSHTATLLPDGKVLVAGGFGTTNTSDRAFVFDPEYGTNGLWTTVGSLNIGRWRHAAILLPNGKVLVVGGEDKDFNFLKSAEIFDPATRQWTPTGSMGTGLYEITLTLLPNGKVLAEAGFLTRTAQLYDVGLGFSTSSQPQVTAITSPLDLGNALAITGSNFRGVSEGSGGNGAQDSPGDCPVIQLRNIENGQVLFLSSTNWQTNSYVSLPVTNFPSGYALATLFVNGIPSISRILLIAPALTQPALINPTRLASGEFQFNFINTPGMRLAAMATTNLSLAPGNWTVLGEATEIAPGQFQFTDPHATNIASQFYRVSSLDYTNTITASRRNRSATFHSHLSARSGWEPCQSPLKVESFTIH